MLIAKFVVLRRSPPARRPVLVSAKFAIQHVERRERREKPEFANGTIVNPTGYDDDDDGRRHCNASVALGCVYIRD